MPELDSLGSAAGKLGSALQAKETCAEAAARAGRAVGAAAPEDLAHALTNMAEHGKGVLVEEIMFGLSSGERIDMLRQMDRINEEHRKTNHNLPDLVINYDKNHYEIAIDLPGTKNDKVIWSATVGKDDQITSVLARNGKDYQPLSARAPGASHGADQPPSGDPPGSVLQGALEEIQQNQTQTSSVEEVARRLSS